MFVNYGETNQNLTDSEFLLKGIGKLYISTVYLFSKELNLLFHDHSK